MNNIKENKGGYGGGVVRKILKKIWIKFLLLLTFIIDKK